MRNTVKVFLKALTQAMLAAAIALQCVCCVPHGAGPDADVSAAPSPERTEAPEPPRTPGISYRPGEGSAQAPIPAITPEPALEARVSAFMDTMSVEAKLGQLVMFGCVGAEDIETDFAELFSEYYIGNVILYGSNIDKTGSDGGFGQCAALIRRIDETNTSGVPRLYSTDVEGGSVMRFRWSPPTLSAAALGGLNDENIAFEQFARIGGALRQVGINVDLAPVLDYSPTPSETFLGQRIISNDIETIINIGGAAIDGLRSAQCLSTAKHFPGHGGTDEDSHSVTPVIRKTLAELRAYDFAPFRAAVERGVDCVLVAHILYPALDPEDIASMSDEIITGILRNGMGFDGIVISDDFRMKGLSERYGIEDAAVRFINAGGDIILCGAVAEEQRRIMRSLMDGYESGALTIERIDESVFRVLMKKTSLGWLP